MTFKTTCQQCAAGIEFDAEQANEFIACPTCGKQTRLLVQAAPATIETKKPASGFKFSGFVVMIIGFLATVDSLAMTTENIYQQTYAEIRGATGMILVAFGVVILALGQIHKAIKEK